MVVAAAQVAVAVASVAGAAGLVALIGCAGRCKCREGGTCCSSKLTVGAEVLGRLGVLGRLSLGAKSASSTIVRKHCPRIPACVCEMPSWLLAQTPAAQQSQQWVAQNYSAPLLLCT